jgi:hypothetical protein
MRSVIAILVGVGLVAGSALVGGSSSRLCAEDRETCRAYCRQVLSSCELGQRAGCGDKYFECLRGCPR